MAAGCIVEPLKIGLKFRPPKIVLIYHEKETGKQRRRNMPIRSFDMRTDVTELAHALRRRHAPFLDNVTVARLEKFLRLIQEKMMPGVDIRDALETVNLEFRIDPDVDLNKVDFGSPDKKKASGWDSPEECTAQESDTDSDPW
ncbi:unnamed protein product [Cyprideis torosa]|uniref:Centrosomal protein of 19 kDa n=1 Tax=Cyprideis torosa TaxID=163714 RepID=A0A7R8ZJX5_9CRUS|nr:unnamed protein product [Cyprideis torosa]CAG0883226.1 unnamed protein product [Cyprideis torosa]